MTGAVALKAKDYKSGVKPIWCPGCGHFSVFNAITKAMAALRIEKDDAVLISASTQHCAGFIRQSKRPRTLLTLRITPNGGCPRGG